MSTIVCQSPQHFFELCKRRFNVIIAQSNSENEVIKRIKAEVMFQRQTVYDNKEWCKHFYILDTLWTVVFPYAETNARVKFPKLVKLFSFKAIDLNEEGEEWKKGK
jgi:hypothetical protein